MYSINRFLKRFFDVVICLVALVVLAEPLLRKMDNLSVH